MDVFEETIQSLSGKSSVDKAAAIAEMHEKCPCPGCPTYNRCASEAKEKLFCINGRSFMCISDQKTCACPTCGLGQSVGLKNTSFCTRGSEMGQRYEHTIWGTSLLK
ncbi:DUF2769 domain-containing protein [Methanosphaerula palustris]|uniref:DUF2769 domain-containing protein n=1 Tax=Methanosphaerula palustris (strain ATCC BAA-1556 / DSM 19958 / E1-9c) TaxID=521011 RepID=B8GFX7_METPE|nr:DUF2769 domain-containing protein [Methanosphaerula palustris]ACL18010.1 conserved hypothetical protein [Methanosphaerula palustris E1-9c]